MSNLLHSAHLGLPHNTSATQPDCATSITQHEFDLFYRQLDQVFGGNQQAAKNAATHLRQKLQNNHITDVATGAPFTLKMCELYGEYGPDVAAAREAYNEQQQKGAQPNDAD